MKERIKTIMAIIGIILLSLLIIFITIVKYYIRPHKTLPVLKQETIKNIATTVNQIRNIDNLKNIEQNNFLISNIEVTGNENYMQITGNLKNISKKEKTLTINSTIYNENKEVLESKNIIINSKIELNEEIPIFINHYYEEFEKEFKNIKYYKISILN